MVTPSQGATDDKWFDSGNNTQKRSQDNTEPILDQNQTDVPQ